MSFGESNALWGLLGITIPILIHFLSKKKRLVIPFGTLRFLESVESNAAKTIQLTDLLLLFIRIILISAVCFLMAKPLLEKNNTTIVHYIEDKIFYNDKYRHVLKDIVDNNDIQLFTHINSSNIKDQFFRSTWTFIDYLNHQSDSCIVYTHSLQKYFIGAPVKLDNHILWNIIPQISDNHQEIAFSKDDVSTVWDITSESTFTKYSLRLQNPIIAPESQPLKFKIIQDTIDSHSSRLKEIIGQLSFYLPYEIEWVDSIDSTDWKFVIGKPYKDYGPKCIYWSNYEGSFSFELLANDQYELSGSLNSDDLLRSNFPLVLASVLNSNYIKADSYDQLTFNPNSVKVDAHSQNLLKGKTAEKNIASSYWWIIILIILLTERIVGLKKQRQ